MMMKRKYITPQVTFEDIEQESFCVVSVEVPEQEWGDLPVGPDRPGQGRTMSLSLDEDPLGPIDAAVQGFEYSIE